MIYPRTLIASDERARARAALPDGRKSRRRLDAGCHLIDMCTGTLVTYNKAKRCDAVAPLDAHLTSPRT